MFAFADIVLTRFPFTDLSGDKRRPALVVSRNNEGADLIVCFITSVQRTGSHTATILPGARTGLKVQSVVRFDKLATLERTVIVGKLGSASTEWLDEHRQTFFGAFGFTPPSTDHSDNSAKG